MTSIRTEIEIAADAAHVWKTVGDFANGPVGMARGHVLSSQADGDVRVVRFADGRTVRERLIARDDEARRIVYSVIGGDVRPDHDNAVMEVIEDGRDRCRFIWSRDLLPDWLAAPLLESMRAAGPVIKRTLEDR